MKPHTALLFVIHIFNEAIKDQIKKLRTEAGEFASVYIVYQADKVELNLPMDVKQHAFTIQGLNKLGYTSWGCTIMDGNFHFVLLDFYRNHPEYDYYWLVEYDVRFNGNWGTFFSFFQNKEEDFLTAHVETKEDNPNWMRWHEIELKNIPNSITLYRSFNPICRFSNRAFALLHSRCLLGDRGHNELLMSTLFKHFKLKIADFGGHGRFIYAGHPELFYTYDPDRRENDKCTHRCYPPYDIKDMRFPDMIYHPIK